jgi:hypothetical protein
MQLQPTLQVGLVRIARWPGVVTVLRDHTVHNLTLVLNSPNAGASLIAKRHQCTARECLDVPWELQPEVTRANNVVSVPVKFCGGLPEINAGQFVYLGGRPVPYGGVGCLRRGDVQTETVNGVEYFGVTLGFTEVNTGLQDMPGGFKNAWYYDDLENPVIEDAERRSIVSGDARSSEYRWSLSGAKVLNLTGIDTEKHALRFVMDVDDQTEEVSLFRTVDSEHSVHIQCTFSEHTLNIQGTFREHSVNERVGWLQ